MTDLPAGGWTVITTRELNELRDKVAPGYWQNLCSLKDAAHANLREKLERAEIAAQQAETKARKANKRADEVEAELRSVRDAQQAEARTRDADGELCAHSADVVKRLLRELADEKAAHKESNDAHMVLMKRISEAHRVLRGGSPATFATGGSIFKGSSNDFNQPQSYDFGQVDRPFGHWTA